MKKVLALVLAFAMVFSTVTVAFAEGEVSEEAKALATLGMLEGDGSGVTVEYTSKQLTRLSAAAALLKLKGLYEEAVAFEGEDNFADVKDYAWAEGRNLMAYLKANPGLGFGGDENGNFNPGANIDEKSYYKVLLETLGYKQTTADVAGDFAWEEVLTFAESVGLKPVNAETFTVDALAKATVSALKANTKEGKAYVETLVEAGKLTEEVAVAAGVMEEAPEVTVAVDSAEALGNTVVEVTFEDDVDAEALENAEYVIEGLEVEDVVVTGSDTVRLTTEAMTAGKLYTLTVGEDKVKFTGIKKVSGAPKFEDAKSDDIEEVVLTFDKNLDFESATDPANYTISGVEIVEAVVDGAEVTLTTNGLEARKQYTVKASNIESVDGGLLRGSSKSFYTRFDTTPPSVKEVEPETNQRVIVTFSEEVTQESAEDIANYTITADDVELAILDAIWDDDDEDKVELITEIQEAYETYELSISNIVDQTKAANVMTKTYTKKFKGVKEDTTAPTLSKNINVLSRNKIVVTFNDKSRIDEVSVLDANNYILEKGDDEYSVENVEKLSAETGTFKAIVTVEDLNTGTYVLEVVDIADEFGNAIEEDEERFTVNTDSFASSTVKDVDVEDENTIKLTFTKQLDEDTAEDIANYSLDGDIGTPIEATYEEDGSVYTVELEVNDLTDGYTYELTIDGVEDLAGNLLDYSFDVDVDINSDTDGPVLENAYAVNKFVVALEFDEEIDAIDGAELVLRDVDGNASDVTLLAKDVVDDVVVEFSDYGNKQLAENVTYFIYSVNDKVLDVKGNAFALTEEDQEYYEIYSDEDAERAEVVSVEQTNGKTFKVTMSRDVTYKDENVTTDTSNGTTFDIVVDGSEVEFIARGNGKIDEDVDYYEFNLSDLLTDLHGIDVLDEDEEDDNDAEDVETAFYTEYEDEDGPYIVDVIAVDREHVEVHYSEDIDGSTVSGVFSIKNSDEDVSKKELVKTADVDPDDNSVVVIELKSALEGRYDYTLTILKDEGNGVKDVVGNEAEEQVDDEFYFNGTDLAPLELGN